MLATCRPLTHSIGQSVGRSVPVQPASGPSSDISPQSLIVSHNHAGGTQMDVFTHRNWAVAGQPLCVVVIATVVNDNLLLAVAVTTGKHLAQCIAHICVHIFTTIITSVWPHFGGGEIQGLFKDFQLPFPDLFQLCFTTLESVYGIT